MRLRTLFSRKKTEKTSSGIIMADLVALYVSIKHNYFRLLPNNNFLKEKVFLIFQTVDQFPENDEIREAFNDFCTNAEARLFFANKACPTDSKNGLVNSYYILYNYVLDECDLDTGRFYETSKVLFNMLRRWHYDCSEKTQLAAQEILSVYRAVLSYGVAMGYNESVIDRENLENN